MSWQNHAWSCSVLMIKLWNNTKHSSDEGYSSQSSLLDVDVVSLNTCDLFHTSLIWADIDLAITSLKFLLKFLASHCPTLFFCFMCLCIIAHSFRQQSAVPRNMLCLCINTATSSTDQQLHVSEETLPRTLSCWAHIRKKEILQKDCNLLTVAY